MKSGVAVGVARASGVPLTELDGVPGSQGLQEA